MSSESTRRRDALGIDPSLYPFAGAFREVAPGVRMHYLDVGPTDGRVVVLVHGNPTWSFAFREIVLDLVARGFRCIVPDHIGMGLSDKPGDEAYRYTLARRIEDLTALLAERAPVGKVHLVVHDWGGMIGMGWASSHPSRVASIVAMNTGCFHLPATKPFPWPLALTRTPLGALLVRGGNAFASIASRVCVTKGTLPKAVRHGYVAPYGSWADRIATLRFVEDIPLRPEDEAYRVVSAADARFAALREVPMLLAFGLRDFVFDVHFLDGWIARFPAARVMRFADAGHYVFEDEKATLVPAIGAFLAENA